MRLPRVIGEYRIFVLSIPMIEPNTLSAACTVTMTGGERHFYFRVIRKTLFEIWFRDQSVLVWGELKGGT
jgi:hypothetical protein